MNARNPIFHLSLAVCLAAAPVGAAPLDDLYDALRTAPPEDAPRLQAEVEAEWSRSGSAAMDLLLERGRAALDLGDPGGALPHLTALTDHAPDFAEGWSMKALALAQLGQTGPALADLRRALILDPRHFGAILGLAVMMEDMNRPEQAIDAYELILTIHPNATEAQAGIDRLRATTDGPEI
ncbi:tetratricopeptide repeat protein [Falsirhodobacter halotolerans]|uniref:tetratricopeptide repeat protein n=1 Tax=Falsirhodobacter halotolerans TaxID=1146892 RepID=UPI001FCF8107|nr:tetratricopeptide repeat protein [Falsirhodobacter halotolerans]MCJ8140335.1 tetratricopeptide repeat protein [Falsirhodobacter halotolerans]